LQVQKRGEATSARVQHLAKTKLDMLPANPAITQYVAPGIVPRVPDSEVRP
jgi:cell division protein FtsL